LVQAWPVGANARNSTITIIQVIVFMMSGSSCSVLKISAADTKTLDLPSGNKDT
jgi:hypothetical protein